LKRIGVNNVSFCLELWDQERFKEVCPGKSAKVGRHRHLRAIEYCAKLFDTTNGEMVAGLEPPEKTIEAIEWITDVGAVPTVCVFRPLVGTDYQDVPPPKTDQMLPVFARLYDACMRKGLPIGIAPNIKVSIVMLPDECRWLSENSSAYKLQRMKLFALKCGFGAYFRLRTSRAFRRSA
jgi:hypothetical protein